MLFGSRRRRPARQQLWRDFAARLELTDVSEQEARLRDRFDLGDTPLQPLLSLQRQDQPTLYFFDQDRGRKGPTGTVSIVASGVLLWARQPLAVASARAIPRGTRALEAIVARRTGSHRLELADAPDFNGRVSVFVRDEEAARAWLTQPVRAVIERLLVERGVGPTLVVGGRHVLALCEGAEPAGFEALEAIAADLLTLFAMVAGTVGDGDALEEDRDGDAGDGVA